MDRAVDIEFGPWTELHFFVLDLLHGWLAWIP